MQRTKRGFTLIEMAIVLVIVGLILATTLPLLTERIAKDMVTKGARTVNTLKQELIGYAMLEGHLPTTDYVADNFSGAEDVWGNSVHYYPADGLTGAPGSGNTLDAAASSSLTLTKTTASLTETYSNMAYILVSEGQNMSTEVDLTGLTPDVPGDPLTTPIEYTGDIVFYTRGGYTPAGGERYDDIVEYVSLPYLKAKVDSDSGSGDSPTNGASTWAEEGIGNTLESGANQANSDTQNGAANPIVINEATNELELGAVDEATGCTWYMSTNASIPCTADGNGVVTCTPGDTPAQGNVNWQSLHFLMRFNFLHKDYYTRDPENRYAGGWTFSVISGVASHNTLGTAPCGTGRTTGAGYLGYANYSGAGQDYIDDPKFGVEVDVFKDLNQQDVVNRRDADQTVNIVPNTNQGPWVEKEELNHVSAIYWEFDQSNSASAGAHVDDNYHGHSSTLGTQTNDIPLYSSSTNATGMIAGLADGDANMWLEDGQDHWLRVELVRSNAETTVNAGNTVTYTTYIWFDDTPNATFLNLGASLVGTAAGNYEVMTSKTLTFDLGGYWGGDNINTMMNTIRFGWTTATGSEDGRNNQLVNTANIGAFGWNYTTF